MYQIILILALLFQQQTNTTIVLTLTTRDGEAVMTNKEALFVNDDGQLVGHCVSDENGICTIMIRHSNTGDRFSGYLEFTGGERRRLIGRAGEDVELTLNFEFGKISNEGGHSGTPIPTMVPIDLEDLVDLMTRRPTSESPPRNATTATPIPTLEFVVVDPRLTQTAEAGIEPTVIPTIGAPIATNDNEAVATSTPIPTPENLPSTTRNPYIVGAVILIFLILWGGFVIWIYHTYYANKTKAKKGGKKNA